VYIKRVNCYNKFVSFIYLLYFTLFFFFQFGSNFYVYAFLQKNYRDRMAFICVYKYKP